jgi:hypothetical protein
MTKRKHGVGTKRRHGVVHMVWPGEHFPVCGSGNRMPILVASPHHFSTSHVRCKRCDAVHTKWITFEDR